jgi:hypothetical protein
MRKAATKSSFDENEARKAKDLSITIENYRPLEPGKQLDVPSGVSVALPTICLLIV